jgi:hypothetical protein
MASRVMPARSVPLTGGVMTVPLDDEKDVLPGPFAQQPSVPNAIASWNPLASASILMS